MKNEQVINNMTDAEIEKEWDKGNDSRSGEAIGYKFETPAEALKRDGYSVIREFTSHAGLTGYVGIRDGITVAVLDDNGPWGVRI